MFFITEGSKTIWLISIVLINRVISSSYLEVLKTLSYEFPSTYVMSMNNLFHEGI